jgi:hypothetical protein
LHLTRELRIAPHFPQHSYLIPLQVNPGVRHQPGLLLAIKKLATLASIAAVLACAKEQSSYQRETPVDSTPPQANAVDSSHQPERPVDSSPQQANVVDSLASATPFVRLVDSSIHGIESEAVAKVEVKFGGTTDTIPKLLTFLKPVVTNDGILHGIAMTDEGVANAGFDYDPRTKQLTRFPLPADINGSFAEIEINADARFVAYIAHTEAGGTWAVIRSWPSLKEVMRAAGSEGYPSDVSYDQVRWLDASRFQISYRIRSGAIISVEGNVNTKAMKVDTATTESSQHMESR